MNRISVLDCTLRDGGYCNQWKFGKKNIIKILNSLDEANIDIVECGFLTNRIERDEELSKFTKEEQIEELLPKNRNGRTYVAMINYGEYNLDDLPDADENTIDGIRVAFHKKNKDAALEWCKKLKEKNYKVFIQAMVSMNYSDDEFLKLIEEVNHIQPYAFYIVDSFGMMKNQDLCRFFYLVQHNLSEEIMIGFHSHNNLQLAYSNALTLVNMQTDRRLIIDASVYGMGRGAGNLNTELFVDYLNERLEKKYRLNPLLSIIDEILNGFYQKNYWGYSLPNYLSAIHNAHPNYAGYLDDKKTLTVEAMNEIFDMMSDEKKVEYNSDYIEELYMKYMNAKAASEGAIAEVKNRIIAGKVLLIAPGKSSLTQSKEICKYISENNPIVIGINMSYEHYPVDYLFVSNIRRYRELGEDEKKKSIITSNIGKTDAFAVIKYSEYLNDKEYVKDNAGMMALKWLIQMGVKNVALAGFDGYSHDYQRNYMDSEKEIVTKTEITDKMNQGIKEVINEFRQSIQIEFITDSKYNDR